MYTAFAANLRQYHQTNNAKKLATAIINNDYELFTQIMSTPLEIAWSYLDGEGNTLLHIACKANLGGNLKKKKYYCAPLIKKLGLGYLNIRNSAGQFPFELIGGKRVIQALMEWEDDYDAVMQGELLLRISNGLSLNNGALYAPSEQFNSKPVPGLYYVDDLTINFDRISHGYQCEIPDKWIELNSIDGQDFTLHQRLSMSRFLFRKKATETNQVVANLGFIVSNIHTGFTQFYTFPINVPNKHLVTLPNKGGHSELALFYFLQQDAVLLPIVKKLRETVGRDGSFRVYGVVLDIFSERSMCGGCQDDSFMYLRKYNDFLHQKFIQVLSDYHFKLPDWIKTTPELFIPDKYKLRFVIRVSCSFATQVGAIPTFNPSVDPARSHEYPYPEFGENVSPPDPEFKGLDIKRPTTIQPQTLKPEYRNLELFQNSIILHVAPDRYKNYSANSALKFLKQYNPALEKKLAISKQTVFISRYSVDSKSIGWEWNNPINPDAPYVLYSQELLEDNCWGFA